MTCPICGGDLVGDGYTSPRQCENTLVSMHDKEPDSGPWYCTEEDLEIHNSEEI